MLEQYGQRIFPYISGISEEYKYMTKGVSEVTNAIMELDPLIKTEYTNTGNRLKTPWEACQMEQRPVLRGFMTKTD